MFARIVREAKRLRPELVEIRRQLHRNPELGFEERQTARLIKTKLAGLGLRVTDGIAKTGVTALLTGKGREQTVALRADLDALPIEEQNDLPYKSAKPGVMHACGHDAHTAMLIGAAKILALLKKELKVKVLFIFQPCEEKPRGGAELMIKELPRTCGEPTSFWVSSLRMGKSILCITPGLTSMIQYWPPERLCWPAVLSRPRRS